MEKDQKGLEQEHRWTTEDPVVIVQAGEDGDLNERGGGVDGEEKVNSACIRGHI